MKGFVSLKLVLTKDSENWADIYAVSKGTGVWYLTGYHLGPLSKVQFYELIDRIKGMIVEDNFKFDYTCYILDSEVECIYNEYFTGKEVVK